MTGVVGLVAGACVALAIACAARPMTASQSPASMAVPGAPASSQHDEIDRLAKQIDDARVQLNLPAASTATPMSVAPVAPAAPTCPRAPSDACAQTCTLADSICGNAKKICELAGELPGDAWAQQKCDDSTSTCSAATRRCCECT